MTDSCPECRKRVAPGEMTHVATVPAAFTMTGRNRLVERTWHAGCFADAQASVDEGRAEVAADHREVMRQLREAVQHDRG